MARDGSDIPDHPCAQGDGKCRDCPACQPTLITVKSKSATMPEIFVCTHCDGIELPRLIQQGPAAAA